MTPGDILEISVEFGKGITSAWNFHIIVTLAYIGWIITLRSLGTEFGIRSRLMIVLGYVFFCFTMFWSIEYLYARINDLYEAVRTHPTLTADLGPAAESIKRFAQPVTGISTKVFLPLTAVLFTGSAWWLTASRKPK